MTRRIRSVPGGKIKIGWKDATNDDENPRDTVYDIRFIPDDGSNQLRVENCETGEDRLHRDGSVQRIQYEGSMEAQYEKFLELFEELREE